MSDKKDKKTKSGNTNADGTAGITNRPREHERNQEEKVPPRGTARGETDPLLERRPGQHQPPRDPAPKRREPKYPLPE